MKSLITVSALLFLVSSESIVKIMQNDPSMCKVTLNFLNNSKFMQVCERLEYPDENVEFEKKNIDIFHCLALYDIGFSLCNFGSKHYVMNLPPDSFVFEKHVEALQGSNLCNDLQLPSLLLHEDIKPKVKKLYNSFEDRKKCQDICERLKHPICSVLLWSKQVLKNKQKSSGIFAIDETKENSTTEIEFIDKPDHYSSYFYEIDENTSDEHYDSDSNRQSISNTLLSFILLFVIKILH